MMAFIQRFQKHFPACAVPFLSVLLFVGCSNLQAGSNDNNVNSLQNSDIGTDAQLAQLLESLDGKNIEERKQALNGFRLLNLNSSSKEKAAYVLARLLKKAGTTEDLKQAVPLFEEAAHIPSLWERCQWHISESANTLGDEKLVRRCLNDIIARTAEPLNKAQAQYSLAQSYLRANEAEKAKEQFELIAATAPDSQYALGCNYYLGRRYWDAQESDKALELWRNYLRKSPDGRFAQEIVNALNAGTTITAADHALFAEVSYAHGDWSDALKEWQIAHDTHAWFKQAQSLLRINKKEAAKSLLLSGIKIHNRDSNIPDAAKLLAKLSNKDQAVAIWKYVLAASPAFADVAMYNLALRSPESQALSYYSQIANKYPHSDYAPESVWWLTWDKIKKGKSAAALADCKTASKKYAQAKSGSRFSFWIGKLNERLKQKGTAAAAYKQTVNQFGHHYYGWRAYNRLAALSGKGDRGWSTQPSRRQSKDWTWPEPPYLISFSEIAAIAGPTVAQLSELHQWDECYELLPDKKLPELRSLCLAKLNLPLEAINAISKELHGQPNGAPKWQLSYPLLHARTIANEAAAKHVDPLLAQALIREESRYNIYALSSSNAIGLMQLLPATAMGVAKRLGVPINSKDDIHKPENNIRLGVDYLGYTLGRFKGNAMLAVASYNGGPNAVQSWTKRYPLADPDIFVESIPFQETRDYVRKVFGSYWNYEYIYNHSH